MLSGTMALDIDDRAAATTLLAERGIDLQALLDAPDAVQIKSGREGRAKLLYAMPFGLALATKKITTPVNGENKTAYELRCAASNGLTVQDILPGAAIHPQTLRQYVWGGKGHWSRLPMIPDALLTLWQSMLTPERSIKVDDGNNASWDEVRSAVAAIDPDCDRKTWIECGMAIHSTGHPDGFALWDEWSTRGQKYKRQEMTSQWRSFKPDPNGIKIGSLFHHAIEAGWQRPLPDVQHLFAPVDVVEDFERGKDGNVLPILNNVLRALDDPSIAKCDIAHDTFRGEDMLSPVAHELWRPVTDTDLVALRSRLESPDLDCRFRPIPKDLMRDAISLVASRSRFDSGIAWVSGLKWDGVPRIDRFLPTYFGSNDTPYTRAVGSYIWTALAGRMTVPGIKVDMVPVAVGDQGIKKSGSIAAIAPSPDHFIELDLSTKDADIARLIRGKVVCELAELKGLRAREAEHVKALVTRQHENWVPKFKEHSATYARRCLFFGSSNVSEFLSDSTGHRRWLPFIAGLCDPSGIERDREFLWAEGLHRFRANGIEWQAAERLAREVHAAHVVSDEWDEIISTWMVGQGDRPLRARDILRFAIGYDPVASTERRHEMRLRECMTRLGYVKTTRWVDGVSAKVWVKP
jgi:hypothetical protein